MIRNNFIGDENFLVEFGLLEKILIFYMIILIVFFMIEIFIGLLCLNNSCYRVSNIDYVFSLILVKERDLNENYKMVLLM